MKDYICTKDHLSVDEALVIRLSPFLMRVLEEAYVTNRQAHPNYAGTRLDFLTDLIVEMFAELQAHILPDETWESGRFDRTTIDLRSLSTDDIGSSVPMPGAE